MKAALADAVLLAGGPSAVAARFDPPISAQAVSQWEICPEKRVLVIAEACEFARTPHELRPDLYPYPSDAVPPRLRRGRRRRRR